MNTTSINTSLFENYFGIKLENIDNVTENTLNLIDYILFEKYLPDTVPIFSRIPFFHPYIIPARIRMAVLKKTIVDKKADPDSNDFPNAYFDFSVDCLLNYLKDKYAKNIPTVPFWPENKEYVITLSHDVDSDFIFRNRTVLDSFLDIEEKNGFRSAWYFLSNRYKIDRKIIGELIERGHEIGFHGDTHDYRLPYLKEKKMRRRLDKCKSFLNTYKVCGGRSPNFLRTPLYLQVLQDYLEYDTSFHDSTRDGLTGFNEGCCTCLPFFINNLLEIPTTIPEEFLLLMRNLKPDDVVKLQLKKAHAVKKINGIAHVLTHPEPFISANDTALSVYDDFLKNFRSSDEVWKALPMDINSHWRKRAGL
ncbi:polysaccharide deacetylase family protein [candidate division KSB1 bacterium]